VQEYVTDSGTVRALDDVDAEFGAGRITVLSGPSGSGKSSLLRILAGLDRPAAGRVLVGDTDITTASRRRLRLEQRQSLGYIFQESSRNLFPYLDAGQHIALWRHLRRLPPSSGESFLEAVGLRGRSGALPAQLSGGEQQRLAFAAAVAAESPVVLADEPTSQLDGPSSRLLIDAVLRLRDAGSTMVLASHDPDVVAMADDVIRLDHGRLVGG
jgi:ABC-type lipoprotein export system ATPase subunit